MEGAVQGRSFSFSIGLREISEMTLTPTSALEGIARPGRGGAGGAPGVTLRELRDLGLFSVSVLKGQSESFASAVMQATTLALPKGPSCTSAAGITIIGTGPRQYLLVAEPKGVAACETLLRDAAAIAAFAEQSDGRAVIAVGGLKAREALAKGVSIDLHPKAFPPGAAAVTSAALIGLTLWRPTEEHSYHLAVARSLAGSFWHWLTDSAAEFGYVVKSEPA